MRILITGGTGLIGQAFIHSYSKEYEFVIVSRNPNKVLQTFPEAVSKGRITTLTLAELNEELMVDAVINLAGEPIADKRWSDKQKRLICDSRWQTTQVLINWMHTVNQKPKVFISGSAIGYYGRQDETHVEENFADIHHEFSHELCAQWESIAHKAPESVRICTIRTGVVLSAEGGALGKMLLPFKLGLGGPVSPGTQGFSWIHIEDMVAGLAFLLNNPKTSGAYNFTAPTPVSNAVFSKELAKRLNRPYLFKVPQISMKLLLGEGADLLTTGQFVIPQRLLEAGFEFRYATAEEALNALPL